MQSPPTPARTALRSLAIPQHTQVGFQRRSSIHHIWEFQQMQWNEQGKKEFGGTIAGSGYTKHSSKRLRLIRKLLLI
jgi:hypothetical protein